MKLSVSSTAIWKQIPSDIDVIIGESAELKCALDNLSPALLPTWYDASTNPATAVSEGEIVFPTCPTCSITGTHSNGEYHLTINPVSLNDEGTWRCTVLDASPQSQDAQLTVLVPASIITSPSDQTVTEGTNTVPLQCAATGKPNAITYTWKKGSSDISRGGRYSLNGGSLTISNIVREDDGIYICYASNGVGQHAISDSATVTVNYPPTITTSPSDQAATEYTDQVTLQCTATTGKPTTITYTWKKGSAYIIIGGRYSLNSGSLTISNIVKEDDGIYTCYASNGIGQPDIASATVTVYYPPTITTLPSDETVTEGSISLTLQCTATDGKPATSLHIHGGKTMVISL
ncbi:limbic system-associated membrane protein-like [Saccoglossus kowalevskii]